MSKVLDELIDSIKCLPGVGPKSATRMAYFLLQRDPKGARRLANSIINSFELLGKCTACNNFSESLTCDLCLDQKRNKKILCIIEMPTDLLMFEQTHSFDGMYYILMGRLSPLDGIGPKDLNMGSLYDRCRDEQIEEIIIATNFTKEGDATANYITELLKDLGKKLSRIARGMPSGSEIEYTDSGTLAQAISERKTINQKF
ncbi:MAG: recombination mediator RecR [Proteobacteria bacterium]|nr:recombination mediator RecR [Pseudomonadota bacterium]